MPPVVLVGERLIDRHQKSPLLLSYTMGSRNGPMACLDSPPSFLPFLCSTLLFAGSGGGGGVGYNYSYVTRLVTQ